MTSSPNVLVRRPAQDPRAPRPMSVRECWDQLRRQHEGRLGYLSGRGLRHVVRPFAVVGRAVLLRLPGLDGAAGAVDGQRVRFDVQEQVADGLVAAVEATGRAHLVDRPAGVLAALPDEGWPAGKAPTVVTVQLDDLRGSRRAVGSRPEVDAR